MARATGSYDESDVRIRPNRRGTRPRSKDRPAHEDAVPGRVTGVDRGRYTTLVGDGDDRHVVIAMRARELGRKGIVVGDDVFLVGDTTGRRRQPGPHRAGGPARAPCCAAPPTTPTRSSGSSSPTPTSSSSSRPWPTPSRDPGSSTAAWSPPTTPGWSRCSCSPRPTSPTPRRSSSSTPPLSVRHLVTARHDGSTDGLDALREALVRAGQRARRPLRRRQDHPGQRPGPRRPARHRRRQRRHRPRAGTPRPPRWPSRCPTTTAGSSTPPASGPSGWPTSTSARIIQHFPDLEPGTAQCPRGCTHDEEECALDAWVASGAAGPAGAVAPGLAAPPPAGAHPHDRRLTGRLRRRSGPRSVPRGPLSVRACRSGVGAVVLRLLVDQARAVLRLAVGVGVHGSRPLGPGVDGRGVEVLAATGGTEAGPRSSRSTESVVVKRASGSTSDTSTVSTMVRGSAKWHADRCAPAPSERSSSCGSSCEQISCAFQHRVWKRHPDGGFAGEGTSPTQHDLLALAAQRRVGHRHGRQQRLGVGVGRAGVDLVLRRPARPSGRGT